MKNKILVVIPAYNCSKQITRVITSFNQELINRVFQIVIINDMSRDDTEKKALEAIKRRNSSKFHLYTNNQNVGLGGTHKVGILLAIKNKCSHLAIIHGDDQAETKELNNLIDVTESDSGIRAVLGSRFTKGSKLVGYSLIRILGNKFLNLIFTIVTRQATLDLGSGMNLFAVDWLTEKNVFKLDDNLTFNVDLLLYLYKKNIRYRFVPITWKESDQISNAKIFNIGYKIIKKLLWWKLGINTTRLTEKVYLFHKVY